MIRKGIPNSPYLVPLLVFSVGILEAKRSEEISRRVGPALDTERRRCDTMYASGMRPPY